MAHRKLERAIEALGLSPTELLHGVSRDHRRSVADALLAIAQADDPESTLVREIGRAALSAEPFVPELATAGRTLLDSILSPRRADSTLARRGFLASLGFVPAELWSEVRANPAQQAEWRELFGSDAAHADWPLDTRHFSPEVQQRIAECRTDDTPGGVAIHGDNLSALAALPPGGFRCLYIDPPYNTRSSRFRYSDNLNEDVWLAALGRRLRAAKALMVDDGIVWVQVDHNASDGLQTLLRRTFPGGVQNKVVWAYGGSGRGAKAISGRLPRNYDTLYLSAMDARRFRLNRVTIPFEVSKEEAGGFGFRHDGRRWYKTAPRGDYTDASVAKLEEQGRIHRTREGGIRIKYFLREVDGVVVEDRLVGDVWTDIPDMMHTPREEWTGFASQKPLALMRRVVDLSCRSGDWILDFYAGTGTTACAALERGVRFCAIESGDHFESILIPRVKRALAKNPGIVEIMSSDEAPTYTLRNR